MNKDTSGSAGEMDRILEALRPVEIADDVVEQAARRVWARMSQAVVPAASAGPVEKIRGCAGFRGLIPAYVIGNLSEARTLLFEDHVRECVSCRRALEAARPGGARGADHVSRLSVPRPWAKWAAGLAVAAGLALVVFGAMKGFFPGLIQGGKGAVVEAIHGSLYDVSHAGATELVSGVAVKVSEEIRTTPGSQAVIRLTDGSLVEMSARADLWVSRRSRQTTIHLRQGSVIIQAAKQRPGRHLYVATRDCLVSVKGTIFAVTQGIAGSRVSVIRGVVVVDQGPQAHVLDAGDQFSTRANLAKVSIRDDIAWSRSAGQYLALLGELASIQKQLELMPGPPLRYGSRLMNYLPQNTVVYTAIPNLEPTLSEAESLFQQRMQSSEALREWWNKQEAAGSGEALKLALTEIRRVSQYLGNEIVVAWAEAPHGKHYHPIVLAEVRKPGFPAFLQNQLHSLNGLHDFGLRIVENPSAVLAGPQRRIGAFILLRNNVLAISAGMPELSGLTAQIQGTKAIGFARTPFYAAIRQSYQSGAGWLFCANLEQITGHSVQKGRKGRKKETIPTGFGDVKYLVMERKSENGKTENRAAVTFSRKRRGFAAWLAAPSPMGTLSFVSPKAAFVASLVLKNPKSLMEQALRLAKNGDPHVAPDLSEFEKKTHVSLVKDLAAPLGGELTLAQDGPILPSPAWEAVLEVYHPRRLETGIEKLVDYVDRSSGDYANGLQLTKEETGGRTYFRLRIVPPPKSAGPLSKPFEVDYVFDDGYMIVGPRQAVLAQAIQNRESGYTLAGSAGFQAELPQDQSPYCSALVYGNLKDSLIPLIEGFAASQAMGPSGQEAIRKLGQANQPTVICAYGEPDRVVLASTGSFFGLGLNALMGLSNSPGLMPGIISMRGTHRQTQ